MPVCFRMRCRALGADSAAGLSGQPASELPGQGQGGRPAPGRKPFATGEPARGFRGGLAGPPRKVPDAIEHPALRRSLPRGWGTLCRTPCCRRISCRVLRQRSGRLAAGTLIPFRRQGLALGAGPGNATRVSPARAGRCPVDREVLEGQRPAPDPAGAKRPPGAGRALAGGFGPRPVLILAWHCGRGDGPCH